jgi:D-serine deaminase-like pyridoxal phosphate-dependent protein
LDTPCTLVDLDAMENDLRRCQTCLGRHGLGLRPHIKTHKIPEFAQNLQIKLGAKGVNCQKLGEAEVMVDAGIADILLTYNLIGQTKLDRLVALWVSPAGKLEDLFKALNGLTDVPEVLRLSALHDVDFLPPEASA